MALVGATLFPAVVRAADASDPKLPPAIRTLLDPHASSQAKLRAATRLATSDHPAAVDALVRQSRFDMEPVRARAMESLVALVGPVEADRLRAKAGFDDWNVERTEAHVREWIPTVRGYSQLSYARDLLAHPDPRIKQLGLTAVFRMHEVAAATGAKSPEGDASLLPDSLKWEVVSLVARIAPADRLGVALGVATDLGGANVRVAAPLVMRAVAHADPDQMKTAAPLFRKIFIPPGAEDPHLVAAVAEYLVGADPAVSVAAERALDGLGEGGKRNVIPHLAVHAARDGAAARRLLVEWKAEDVPAVRLAWRIPTIAPADRKALILLLELYASNRPNEEILAGLLQVPEPRGGIEIAKAMYELRDRLKPVAAVELLVRRGELPSANVIAALHLTTDDLAAPVVHCILHPASNSADALGPLTVGQGVAALELLRTTGAPTTAGARAALESLLDHPGERLRIVAAEVLGDPATLARVRQVGWLRDLRSDTLSTRLLAARQLEESGVVDKAFCAVLARAIEQRNMPVREGLTLALERSARSQQAPITALRAIAEDKRDAASQAYARAALRYVSDQR
jgi:hypothetical protein